MEKPNVLFIPIDDLRPQLACYGCDETVSPNIDRLAETGVLFENAFCQVPVCGASRASLLTGTRPTRNRFKNFYTAVDEDTPGALTLPQHYKDHGYTTVSLGKIFHHRDDTAERSWSEDPWQPVSLGSPNWRDYVTEENMKLAAMHEKGQGPAFERADVPDNAYKDGKVADKTIAALHQLKESGEPFFLAAGFLKPHLPFNAPEKYWDYYREADINLADNPFRPENAPDDAMHNWGELRQYFDVPQEGDLPEPLALNLVHGYHAATSYTDAQVGRVIDELDSLGLRENTVIVLWGDHGWQLGEHGLWCKHCNFKTSLNAPMIISAPGFSGGSRSSRLTEFIDVFPTLCELSGLDLPQSLDGRSLVSLMETPDQSWSDAVFSRYQDGDSVKTERHLYTEWTDGAGIGRARMLYDHVEDPSENMNISEAAENTGLVAELSGLLDTVR